MDEFKRLERKLICKGNIIDYYRDTIAVPNGNVVEWDFIAHKGAAAVVPVLPDGRILMVKQYRNALERYTLEIPAGGVDSPDEPHYDAAMRELKEETGYEAESMELLIKINTTVAFCNELISVYVAFVQDKRGEQDLDDDEFIHVVPCKVEELEQMIYDGKINDSKTISAIMSYKNKFLNPHA